MFSVSAPTRFSCATMLMCGFIAFTAFAAVLDFVFYGNKQQYVPVQSTSTRKRSYCSS